MNREAEAPSYGFKGSEFITLALAASGLVVTALAIAFTVLSYSTWQLAICWFFGPLLIVASLAWDSMSSVSYPANLRALEESLLSLLRTRWDGKGKVLDIGTGSGRLAVPIAREHPEAHVTGVDPWANSWSALGLSKERAEQNAAIAKVSDRCVFQHGSALELPFEDGEFSLVVSAFAFHEIKVPDRTTLIAEAVRVLAPGGSLLICDLFPRGYNVKTIPELLAKVEQLGMTDVKHEPLKDVGVDLGRLSFIWRMSYLSGKKRSS
jgi:ubiquinone/menaquinone biosynthesis C-methylase UbiE